ncbi:MAG: phosphate ABC transporter, permease protein PstA, partial [Planctomycetota bacterium]
MNSSFWKKGHPWVWVSGALLSLTMIFTALLLFVILFHGLKSFWPASVVRIQLEDGRTFMGEITNREKRPGKGEKIQLKVGNRELYGFDFRWISLDDVSNVDYPEDAMVLEREEYGNFYGFLKSWKAPSFPEVRSFQEAWQRVHQELDQGKKLAYQISEVNYQLATIEDKLKYLKYYHKEKDSQWRLLKGNQKKLQKRFHTLVEKQNAWKVKILSNKAVFEEASGRQKEIPLAKIVRYYSPNVLSFWNKVSLYFSKWKELLWENPRESNTEGGIYPAIFGTVMLVFLMSLISFPLGVIAAIYLREYAKQGILVRIVQIAVNNLAGIPSIVFGVFGLGFF